ncbi:MAG: sugar transferase [Pirellulaceae bacterium]|nr:sugar transferase [Pirellulaceae bacterium]
MFKPLECSMHCTSSGAGFALRPDTFCKILERERMRADRCERPFSVLVFTADTTATEPLDFAELTRYLQGRLRTTDVVGYLNRQCLAALLFDTDRAGARTLLDDIQENYSAALQQHICVIHTHPADPVDETVAPAADAMPEHLFLQPIPRWKRVADIFLASISLIVFFPIMVCAAVMIKLTSPGPILFLQRRVGLAGRPFVVYKFRTMCEGAAQQQARLRPYNEQDGPAFKLKNDPRVTSVGKYLRKTCIDEFPQFWNVLRGEMSIVGPRPLPLDESADCINWQRRRLDVTPGMTCIWQVSGGIRVSFIEWMRMDLRYIRHRTLWHDFKLLLKTVRVVLFHRASQ